MTPKNSDSKLYIVITFLIGIILTQYLFSPFKEKVSFQAEKENEEETQQTVKRTKMAQEDRGWRVSYLTNNNPMAGIGIQNNDLILYELIDEAKQNPSNQKLVARLERVFQTLQR
ncbi:MAG: hypothetical protein H7256_11265 [Bdellovibrio sp.]|nr:hypothetical protein [Bdellovibrio sp.]